MKKTTFFVFLFLSMFSAGYSQEIQVGNGTNESGSIPISNSKDYSYSQSIYLASEINAAGPGMITYLKWYYTGSSTMDSSQDLDIYIGVTSKMSFASKNDWEPIANLTK